MKEHDDAVAHFESAKQTFIVAMKKKKEEVASRKVAKAERDTVMEQVCAFTKSLLEAAENF